MRFEGKTEQEALENALRQLGRPANELKYQVVRDEKSFWGGRVVEIDVEEFQAVASRESRAESPAARPSGATTVGAAPEGATDAEAFAAVEATLTELLSAAGFLVEIRRQPGEEMLFELIGDDVEPLLANKGEGLNGL
ncbi:MAG TPA: Jag N-terminal domain-containing protein, partial [Thermoanaerobaculia bacterium]|nr:Jag N-terminal domain-containing protein [Thermoanaerobaculia bacterium]